jgi:hypothetical protein
MGAYLHNRLLKVSGARQLHRLLMSLMTLFTVLSLAQRETFVVSLYLLPGAWSTGLTVEKPVSLKIQGVGSPRAPITRQNLDKPAPTFRLQTRFRLSAIDLGHEKPGFWELLHITSRLREETGFRGSTIASFFVSPNPVSHLHLLSLKDILHHFLI